MKNISTYIINELVHRNRTSVSRFNVLEKLEMFFNSSKKKSFGDYVGVKLKTAEIISKKKKLNM